MVNVTGAATVLPIGIRAWATRTPLKKRGHDTDHQGGAQRRYPHESLVFDTETRDEAGQRLLVGIWRFYRDNLDADPATRCIEEGLFYPDDMPDADPDGFSILSDYASSRAADVAAGCSTDLKLWPVSRWLDERLFEYGYRHRNRCYIVGFNLPFDLAGLASYFSPARKGFHGGWSLGFWGHFTDTGDWRDKQDHPRLLLKSIDPRRTLIRWGTAGANPDASEAVKGEGRFVDLRTLAFALTDRSLTLEGACELFGSTYEKRDVSYGVYSPDLLTYGREDVAATAELYRRCLSELASHSGIKLEPHRLYSPASVGAEYLAAMGVDKPLQRHQLAPEFLGDAMSAFYGGRAEARIVRTPMPVVVADFTSMYPAQNALLNTWDLITADTLRTEDVTTAVQALMDDPGLLQRLHERETWADDIGVTFVQLSDIDGAVLPVRAGYEPPTTTATTSDADNTFGAAGLNGNLGIGVNPLHYDGTLVYALPDVLAAVLLGNARCTVKKATRLRAEGRQPSLQPVLLRGRRLVDPADTDPFVAMIEERHRIRNDETLTVHDRARLDLFLKITANATSYGSLARFDRRDRPKPVKVTVYGPGDVRLTAQTATPEDPGPYCFPPVAASITAGARLILAMLETDLQTLGGSYAFMDTDSAAIVATRTGGAVACAGEPAGTLHALSHDDVRAVLRRFEQLNPFGPDVSNADPHLGRSPWKIEHASMTEPLTALVISAKRYLLYRASAGSLRLVFGSDEENTEGGSKLGDADEGTEQQTVQDWSEHGIGLYQDPLRLRDTQGRRIWMRQAWDYLLQSSLGHHPHRPAWAQLPALTQFTMSSPRHRRWFGQKDNGEPAADTPRPGGFGLLGQADPSTVFGSHTPMPATRYTAKPSEWLTAPWYDRATGEPLTIITADPETEPERYTEQLMAGSISLRTLGQVIDRYQTRPEHKSLAPQGTPAGSDTVGKLRRRPIHAAAVSTTLIGKESNKLAERISGSETRATSVLVYGALADPYTELMLPVLKIMGATLVAQETGISQRRVRDWLHGRASPHAGKSGHYQAALSAAGRYAAVMLEGARVDDTTREPLDRLHRYLAGLT